MIVNYRPERITIQLTDHERKVLVEDTIAVPPEIIALLKKAPVHGKTVSVSLTLGELEVFLDGIAAESNHATSERKERFFDDLFDKLEPAFDAHASAEKREQGQEEPDTDSGKADKLMALLMATEALGGIMDLLGKRKQPKSAAPRRDPKTRAVRAAFKSTSAALDLGGLTPDQALLLCQCGWWKEPHPIELRTELPPEQYRAAPLLRSAEALLSVVEEAGGAPLTEAGQLRRTTMEHMIERLAPEDEIRLTFGKTIKYLKESDIPVIHVARVVCEASGLLERFPGRLQVSALAKRLRKESQTAEMWKALFAGITGSAILANLGYGPTDAAAVEATIPYILYRLSRLDVGKEYGASPVARIVFTPAVLKDVSGLLFMDLPAHYFNTWVVAPLNWMGLAETRASRDEDPAEFKEGIFKLLPLFGETLRFNL